MWEYLTHRSDFYYLITEVGSLSPDAPLPAEDQLARERRSESGGDFSILAGSSLVDRSFDAICDALKIVLETVRPGECANYLKHAGYVQT